MVGNQQALLGNGLLEVDRKRFNQSIVEDIDARASHLKRRSGDHGTDGEPSPTSEEESGDCKGPDRS